MSEAPTPFELVLSLDERSGVTEEARDGVER